MVAARARNASGEVRRDGVTSSDPPLSRAASRASRRKCGKLRRKGEGLALAAEQHGDARAGQRIDLGRETLRGAGEALRRDAVHGAEGIDDVVAGIAVMDRRRDQVEAMLRHLRILDVQGVGLGHVFQRERDGNAAAADGDDEAWPGWDKRLI